MSQPPDLPMSAVDELLTREFEALAAAGPTQPPKAPTIDELQRLLNEFEDGKQQIICHPDDRERVEALLRESGYGAFYRVVPSQVVDAGTAYLIPSRREVLALPPRPLDR